MFDYDEVNMSFCSSHLRFHAYKNKQKYDVLKARKIQDEYFLICSDKKQIKKIQCPKKVFEAVSKWQYYPSDFVSELLEEIVFISQLKTTGIEGFLLETLKEAGDAGDLTELKRFVRLIKENPNNLLRIEKRMLEKIKSEVIACSEEESRLIKRSAISNTELKNEELGEGFSKFRLHMDFYNN